MIKNASGVWFIMSEDILEKIRELNFRYVEAYFRMLKAARDLENKIPEMKTKEEKVKAFKAYFNAVTRLRELESEVREMVETL